MQAVLTKTALMRTCGDQSTALLVGIQPYLRQVPSGGQLRLLNPKFAHAEYSMFRMNGFNVLRSGLHRLNELASGHPFYTRLVQDSGLQSRQVSGDALVLSLDTASGKVYRLR